MDVREHPPVPLRTLFVSTIALSVPVTAQVLAPDAAVQYELLLWLLALIPAFLLAYHRGWRGAAAALASGMAVLSLSQAALTYLGSGVRDWTLMLAVVAIYLGVSIGIGWVTELLHQARSHAERMEDEARSAALRAQAVAERLSAVAAAASGVLGSLEPAALAETLSACASTVVSFGTFELLLNDSHLHALVPAGPVQTSALEGRPALVAEAEAAIGASASRVVPFGAEAQTGPAGTAALIPVAAEGEVLGLLVLTGSEAHGFTAEDLQVLEALAACAAGALLNIDMLLARDGAEHALRLSEGRFRTLIEDASELIVILDAEGHVRYESPAVPRLLGQRRGQHPLACVHPSERESARARLAGLMGKRSGTLVSEVRVMDRTGAWRILEVLATNLMHDPAVAGIVVNARDVTVQRQAAEALRDSEHRYRRFFENDLAGAFLADATGVVLDCNPRFAAIFGFEAVPAAGVAHMQRLHPDGSAGVEALCDALRRNGRVDAAELVLLRGDGSEVTVLQTLVGIFDGQGELEQLLGYVFDVTDQRRTEDRLRQAQKMEAVGQLAGGVAHDFNNMLMAMLGYASLLEQEVAADTPAAEYVAGIHDTALRAADLTHQLLAFSRRQVLRPRLVDPGSAVASAEQMLRRLLPASIRLETQLEPVSGSVRVDPTQFQQVLLNLAVNARDAMPHGGVLSIRMRRVQRTVEGTGGSAGESAELTVSDTGRGMDEATLRRIFEPFFTTKRPGEGTGLGLSTAYGIVSQSGGRMEAESEPGQGSTFRVYLPLHAAPAEPDDMTPAPTLRRGGTVLLAEDEEAVRYPMRLALEREGFSVLAAGDGEEALRLAEAYGGELDLLVTDVVMPRMGGVRLAEALRRRQPSLGVVVVSGYPDRVVAAQDGLPEGCVFLQKPVLPARLVSAMHSVMGVA